jgi:hypothetical protein
MGRFFSGLGPFDGAVEFQRHGADRPAIDHLPVTELLQQLASAA